MNLPTPIEAVSIPLLPPPPLPPPLPPPFALPSLKDIAKPENNLSQAKANLMEAIRTAGGAQKAKLKKLSEETKVCLCF